MEGVDPGYRRVIESFVGRLLTKHTRWVLDRVSSLSKRQRDDVESALRQQGVHQAAMAQLKTSLDELSRGAFWNEIIDVVALLPKHELATMAQALVALQSLKRRISFDADTVGEPVDVAIISKGDGFIWVKRKHYFEPSLNQAFMASYLRR
jgi:hypothetical protein